MIYRIILILILPTGIFNKLEGQEEHQRKEQRNMHIGLLYPLSTNGFDAPEIENKFSLHAIGGISAGERGICIAGVGHVTRGELSGIQLSGFGNVNKGKVRGITAAGFGNVANDVQGFTVGGFGNLSEKVSGFQAAGFGNISTRLSGMQYAGFGNVAEELYGFQAAGFMNVAQSAQGFQLAGFMNISGDRFRGFQTAGFMNLSGKNIQGFQSAGFMNAANKVQGFQIAGFINIAQKVKGPQIAGFINIADSSDMPIGIINIIKNGQMHLQSSVDELGNIILDFRSGSRRTYGFIGVGFNQSLQENILPVSNIGIGMHHPIYKKFSIRTELQILNMQSKRQEEQLFKSALRALADLKIGRLHFFAGPSIAYARTLRDLLPNYLVNIIWGSGSRRNYLIPGVIVGISYRLRGV